jgi:hypothetical protein
VTGIGISLVPSPVAIGALCMPLGGVRLGTEYDIETQRVGLPWRVPESMHKELVEEATET